ncbi:MAG: hypothetical protein ACFFAS_01915 [Promethearchaeota archaeon]
MQTKYPYVPNLRVFDEVLKIIQNNGKVPSEQEIVDELRITKIKREANSTLSILQRIGILDENFELTDIGKRSRLKGQKRREAFSDLLSQHKGFLELLQLLKKHPGDFPKVHVENHLISDEVKSPSARAKIISFFRHLLDFSDQEKLLYEHKKSTPNSFENNIEIDSDIIPNINNPKINQEKTKEFQKNPIESLPNNQKFYEEKKKFDLSHISDKSTLVRQFLTENLHIEINENWDAEKISLLFDRIEKLLKS